MQYQNATSILYEDNGQQGTLKSARGFIKDTMIEFAKEYHRLKTPNKVEDAENFVRFVKWLEENYTFFGDCYKAKDPWRYKSFVKSLGELYAIFKTEEQD